ncbi:MAG: hypothetical protein ACR2P7_00460 [bacterium]
MSGVEIVGYSERGILNALLYEIRYRRDGEDLLNRLIGEANFPFAEKSPPSGAAKIFVEQSFSDFGDADAVIIINADVGKCAVFVEAKVKNYGGLRKALSAFEQGVATPSSPPNNFSSNLFTQIYHKQKFMKHGLDEMKAGVEFPSWSTKQTRKIGDNDVVIEAAKEIKRFDDAPPFYLMLIPDSDKDAKKFFDNTLRVAAFLDAPGWDSSNYGYLTWETVEAFCRQHELNDTHDVFKHNDGQIY